MNTIFKEICKMAIEMYGANEQEGVAIEECAELIQAINHKHRGRVHNIPEEIADVEIMLEQLKIINDCADSVERIKRYKIKRLIDRMRGDQG
jgi:NTP pyrophosphatase (non-canonical NTP hydrolase)